MEGLIPLLASLHARLSERRIRVPDATARKLRRGQHFNWLLSDRANPMHVRRDHIGKSIMQTLHDNDLDSSPSSQKEDSSASHVWAVFLAGGDGVRLRDLTRRIAGDSRPKQFCRIIGGQSLFRQTRTRLTPLFSGDRQVFVLSRAHEKYYAEDLTDAGDSHVIEQPLNRGTGDRHYSGRSFASYSVILMLWSPSSLVIIFTATTTRSA